MDKPAGRRSSAYVIALSSVAAIGGFLFGFDSGVINGAVDALARAFGTQAAGTGFAVASVLLGCAVGCSGAHTRPPGLSAANGHCDWPVLRLLEQRHSR